MSRSFELVTGPAVEPVSLAELKLHARIDGADEDALLSSLIVSARQYVSEATRRALVTETWSLTIDGWPSAARQEERNYGLTGPPSDWWDGVRETPISTTQAEYLEIARGGFQTATRIVLLDEAGAEREWLASNWYTSKVAGFGRVHRKRGVMWPIPLRDRAGIRIEFKIGYGDAAVSVPSALRQAILMLAAHWYDNRQLDIAKSSGLEMQLGISALIAQHRLGR